MNSTRRGTLALLIVIALGCVLYGTGAVLGLPHSVQLWHSTALSRIRPWPGGVSAVGSQLDLDEGMQSDASPGVSQSQLQAAAEAHFAAVSDKRAVAAAARTDAQAAEADSTAEAAAFEVTAAQADLVDKALSSEHSATGSQAGQGRSTTGNTSSGVPNSKPTILSEDTGDRRAAAVNQASKASRSLRRGSTAAPKAAASTAVVRRRAGPSEPVAAAGDGAAGVAVGMREAARAGLGRLAQRLQTAATLRPARPVEALPGAQKSTGGRSGGLQRADLVVAMPSAHDRLPLVQGSRVWRHGIPSFIALNWDFPATEHPDYADMTAAKEVYGAWEDTWHTQKPGDTRAAITPFLAHAAMKGNYKWMLYGDDDTVFFIDNVISMLEPLDPEMPYFLTDHLWYPDASDRKVHPNRAAPRCLPCGYKDPLHTKGNYTNVPLLSYRAPEGCPCTLDAVCRGADNPSYWGEDCRWRSGEWWEPNPGWWYFEHGGAGAIMSVGLMRKVALQQIKDMWQWGVRVSGDSAFMNAIYHLTGILPTDPGYGYYRSNLTLFDPGWHGEQPKGPEDAGTVDLGNDPVGVLDRLERALSKDPQACDAACHEVLDHVVTTHIRARYASASNNPTAAGGVPYDDHEEFRPTIHMQHRLGKLFEQYSARRHTRSWFD